MTSSWIRKIAPNALGAVTGVVFGGLSALVTYFEWITAIPRGSSLIIPVVLLIFTLVAAVATGRNPRNESDRTLSRAVTVAAAVFFLVYAGYTGHLYRNFF